MKRSLEAVIGIALVVALFSNCGKNDVDAVDLGLTSGTLWATRNVGAVNQWDYGEYFMWGMTVETIDYDWLNYSLCKADQSRLTKYCNIAEYGDNGFTDTISTLEANDDAATTKWGHHWLTPTMAQWYELVNECYWVWTSNYKKSKVCGYIVYKAKIDSDKGVFTRTPDASYSTADTHIFLPANGYRYGQNYYYDNIFGNYWSGTLCKDYPCHAGNFVFDSTGVVPESDWCSRIDGLSVRPVRKR